MKVLSATDIIRIWELGLAQPPFDRVVTMLAPALPEMTSEELFRLSLGQSNTYLLSIREHLFGLGMNCYTECPDCGESLEFDLSVPALKGEYTVEPNEQEYELSVDGYDLRFRLLNNLDLKAAAEASSSEAIRGLLVERCVLESRREGEEISAGHLPENVVATLVERLSECDPQAELLIGLECPICRNSWQAIFDVAGFFWKELSAHVRRLLGEVHTIASAYGWREAEILAMSARRRHYYLELISA